MSRFAVDNGEVTEKNIVSYRLSDKTQTGARMRPSAYRQPGANKHILLCSQHVQKKRYCMVFRT